MLQLREVGTLKLWWTTLAVALSVVTPLAARAQLTTTSIPLAPFGDAIGGSSGAVLVLTPTSVLVSTTGPDGDAQTSDDLTLLITNVGTSPVVTPLSTPFLSSFSGGLVQLSSTRAMVNGAGPNGIFGNTDDVVFLLDGLGTANTVTAISIGAGILDNSGFIPVSLTASTAVLVTRGPDSLSGTADDTIARITGIGTTNTVVHMPAPFLRSEGSVQPEMLSSNSFLVSSEGPNSAAVTSDDVVFLFTDVGGADTRTSLTVPFLAARRPGRPVRVTATRALVSSAGTTSAITTADDVVYLLDGLGTSNTVTAIPVPGLFDFAAGSAVPLSSTVAVVSTAGVDFSDSTADDTVAVMTGLGTTNTVTQVVVGPLDEDLEARPVPLSSTAVALVGFGPDDDESTDDDVVIIISGVGTSNSIQEINVGGLAGQSSSAITVLGATSLMVASGGPDDAFNAGSDDVVSVIDGIGGTTNIRTATAIGDFDSTSNLGHVPLVLGSNRGIFVSAGLDGDFGGGDDLLRVFAFANGDAHSAPTLGATAMLLVVISLLLVGLKRLATRPA